jgi:hypothetical protein
VTKKISESEVREVIFPAVIEETKSFMTLFTRREFQKLSEKYPLGCTPTEFEQSVDQLASNDQFTDPPEEAFADIYYEDDYQSIVSQIAPTYSNTTRHSMNIFTSGEQKELCVDFYLWDFKGRTDVTLQLIFTNPCVEPFRVVWVDVRIL